MASILKVGTKWRAQVRRKGANSISKTFRTKAEAERWALEMDRAAQNGEMLSSNDLLLSEVIQRYRMLRDGSERPIDDASTEHYTLMLLDRLLGNRSIAKLTPGDLIEFAQKRAKEGAGPYTVNMDVSKLGTVLRLMAPVMRYRIYDVVGEARPLLRHLKLTGGGTKRARRPTSEELNAIFAYCQEQGTTIWSAMPDMIYLALTTGLRRGEVTRILWEDLDERRKLVMVRDRKDPRNKVGNDQWVPLLGDAFDVVVRQSRKAKQIFPYSPQTVSKYFKEACDEKGIPDLHFHDMRHECASALIESGWNPLEARLVTGHKTTKQLETYVNLRPEDLHQKVVPLGKVKKTA